MSQENVAIVQTGYEHFGATGDFLPEIMHPDFVWDMSRFGGWPERQTYAGIEGAREFIADWSGAWDDWELNIEALIDAGDKVVAVLHQRGRSKATGLPVDMEFVQVWTVQERQQIRMEMYANRAEGLEAAGLMA